QAEHGKDNLNPAPVSTGAGGTLRMASRSAVKANRTGRLGIRARLMVLVVIAMVPLMLDRARDILTDRAERIQAASDQALRLARQGMATQNEVIVAARAFLQVISGTYPVDPANPAARESCIGFMMKTAAQAPWLKVLTVVKPDGVIYCSSNRTAIDLDVSHNAHIVQALHTGEFVVSDYFVGEKVGPTLVTVLPRRAPDGAIDALLTALIDLSWFGRVADTVAAEPGAVALMVDGTGSVLAHHPSRDEWIGLQFNDHALVR